ncbi:hypothetical protein D3C81_666140 [compost metagenome]
MNSAQRISRCIRPQTARRRGRHDQLGLPSPAALLLAPLLCFRRIRRQGRGMNNHHLGCSGATAAFKPTEGIAPTQPYGHILVDPPRQALNRIHSPIIPTESGEKQTTAPDPRAVRSLSSSGPSQLILNLQPDGR